MFESIRASSEAPVEWGDLASVMLFWRQCPVVDATYINFIFGVGRNGVRQRAYLRTVSGHYDPESFRICEVELLRTGERVTVVEASVTPSMKAEIYPIRLVYKNSSISKILSISDSECGCPNGLFFCSHVLGALLLCRVV
jgi:hypothetical protein